jgi:hypothetical protein
MKHACLYKHLYEDLRRKQKPRETTTERHLLLWTRTNGTVYYRYEDVDAMLKSLGIVFTDGEIDWLFDHHIIRAGNDAMTVFFWDRAAAAPVAHAGSPTIRRVAGLLETDSPIYLKTTTMASFGCGRGQAAEETCTSRVVVWLKKDDAGAARL